MKEKYSSPVVVSADTIEGKEGAFPALIAGLTAIATAATTGYAAGKVLKSVIKASPTSRLPSFKSHWSDDNDFCMA